MQKAVDTNDLNVVNNDRTAIEFNQVEEGRYQIFGNALSSNSLGDEGSLYHAGEFCGDGIEGIDLLGHKNDRNGIEKDDLSQEEVQVSSPVKPRSWLDNVYDCVHWFGSFWTSGSKKTVDAISKPLDASDVVKREKQLEQADQLLRDLRDRVTFLAHPEEAYLIKVIAFYQVKVAVFRSDVTQVKWHERDDLAHDLRKLEQHVNKGTLPLPMASSMKIYERLGFFNGTTRLSRELPMPTICPTPSTLLQIK